MPWAKDPWADRARRDADRSEGHAVPPPPGGPPQVDGFRRLAIGVMIVALLVAAAVTVVKSISGTSRPYHPVLAYVTGASSQSSEVWLARGAGLDPHAIGPGSAPLVSPDGAFVAMSVSGHGGAQVSLYRVAAHSAHVFASQTAVGVEPLAWSRDSRYLAVALYAGSAARSGLGLIDTSALSFGIVTHGIVRGAAFDPNGSGELVFALSPRRRGSEVDLLRYSPGGGAPTPLFRSGLNMFPAWSGAGVAFARATRVSPGTPLTSQIWLKAADGGRVQQLTELPASAGTLIPVAFTADGRSLIANNISAHPGQVWTVSVATGGAHPFAVGSGPRRAFAASRSGARALIVLGGGATAPSSGRIEAVPVDGGPAQVLVSHGSEPSWNQ